MVEFLRYFCFVCAIIISFFSPCIVDSLRILPHHQNTGGFFVSVLKKVAPLPWEAAVKERHETDQNPAKENSSTTPEDSKKEEVATVVKEQGPRSPARKKRKIRGFKEDPYIFFQADEELWPPIK